MSKNSVIDEKAVDIIFEDEFELLKESLSVIENPVVGITKSLEAYEKGIGHYKNCKKMLEEAEIRLKEIQENI